MPEIKNKILRGDKVIWRVYFLFIFISIVEVFSAMGKEIAGGSFLPFFLRHFVWLVFGFIACFIVHRYDYRKITRWLKFLLIVSIVLVFVPYLQAAFSHSSLSTARWIKINLGFYLLQFQPSEIAKYITIFYTCMLMANNQERIEDKKVFYSLVIPLILVCLIVFWSNFSTSVLIFITCFILMRIGGVRKKYLYLLLLVGVGIVGLALLLAVISPEIASKIGRLGTVLSRIKGATITDIGVLNQSNQSLTAIATGGLLGRGIGNSIQSRFLDEAHNDFIFSIILEEGGIWLGGIVILLYITLLYRMMKITRNAKGYFAAMSCWGMGVVITLQAVTNMSVAVGLIPVTGQTLPFISYGGTSFVIASAFLGMIINISETVEQTENKPKEKKVEQIDNDTNDNIVQDTETLPEQDKEVSNESNN
jgi:cell division protein FtsW